MKLVKKVESLVVESAASCAAWYARCGVGALVLPLLVAMGAMLCMSELVHAQATPIIPESPVDMDDVGAEVLTRMGAVIKVAVGLWAISMLIRKGLTWYRRYAG